VTVFIFALESDKLDYAGLRKAPLILHPLQVYENGGAALFWSNDEFTHFSHDQYHLSVELKRPAIDKIAICHFQWNLVSGWIRVSRAWSGEFSLYVAHTPTLMVACHLRLLAWACRGLPAGVERLRSGHSLHLKTHKRRPKFRETIDVRFRCRYQLNYDQTVVRIRKLVCHSVAQIEGPAALLLSGGIDSASIAAAAQMAAKPLPAFVFSLKRALRARPEHESDLRFAQTVSRYLGLPLHEILLDGQTLVHNVPLAVALAETYRGTIVDDCAALIEVASQLARAGFKTVWMGEAADDLFGSFKFALRYYRGLRLKAYYRHELDVSLPDELAILQRIFAIWGISVVQPFWTADLKEIGYNLPLRYRVDHARLMKMVLRDAFADRLPVDVVRRAKGVTRDTTQIRFVLERHYGLSRERYRSIFNRIFGDALQWPKIKQNSLLQN
jgi:asparagine synthetase B (glutamine-hydrolysing)